MTRISLHQMKFKAPLGVFEDEKNNLNDISVDLSVKVNTREATKADLVDLTIDYQSLYNITESIVMAGGNLLETVAERVCLKVLDTHKSIQHVKITISKLNPPIHGTAKSAAVSMKIKR